MANDNLSPGVDPPGRHVVLGRMTYATHLLVACVCGVFVGGVGEHALLRHETARRQAELAVANAGPLPPAPVIAPAPLPEPRNPPDHPAAGPDRVMPELNAQLPRLPQLARKAEPTLSPGDRCEIHFPSGFGMSGPNGPAYPIARDYLALERMLKYIEARDGKGLIDQFRDRRIMLMSQQVVSAKVIHINERLGTVELRVVSAADYDWPGESRRTDRLLSTEGVMPLSMVRKVEE